MVGMSDKLKFAKRTIKGYDIIDITGDISSDGSKEIVKYVKKSVSGKDKDLYINLEGVRHMNSAALSVLVQLVRDLAAEENQHVLHERERKNIDAYKGGRTP